MFAKVEQKQHRTEPDISQTTVQLLRIWTVRVFISVCIYTNLDLKNQFYHYGGFQYNNILKQETDIKKLYTKKFTSNI